MDQNLYYTGEEPAVGDTVEHYVDRETGHVTVLTEDVLRPGRKLVKVAWESRWTGAHFANELIKVW